MTQRTIYTLMFALGGLMLTLPFATSAISIKTSPIIIESPADTIPDCFGFPLLPFDGERVPQGILIQWVDFTEWNDSPCFEDVASYELQHSINATNFSTIIISDDLEMSSHLHRFPTNGINYYLSASLFIESPAEEPGELNIYDMSGRLIYSEKITLQENSTFIALDFSSWHTGHYIATISGEQLGNEVIRFVKR